MPSRYRGQIDAEFIVLPDTVPETIPGTTHIGPWTLSFRPYVDKRFFDFHEIWRVVRGRRVTNDGMQYDPIRGQFQGHEPFKVGNSAIFKGYLLPHLQWGRKMTTDS